MVTLFSASLSRRVYHCEGLSGRADDKALLANTLNIAGSRTRVIVRASIGLPFTNMAMTAGTGADLSSAGWECLSAGWKGLEPMAMPAKATVDEKRESAGTLLYRTVDGVFEVLTGPRIGETTTSMPAGASPRVYPRRVKRWSRRRTQRDGGGNRHHC